MDEVVTHCVPASAYVDRSGGNRHLQLLAEGAMQTGTDTLDMEPRSPRKREPRPPKRLGRREKSVLALASGGIAGLLYELGVLEALDDASAGMRATDFDVYLGVGSGAAAAALLANGVPPREIALAFEGQSRLLPAFDLDRLLRPNYGELLRKGLSLPVALLDALRENIAAPSELSIQDLLLSLTGVLPSGLYVTSYIESYLRDALSRPGLTNRFEDLKKALYVVATDVGTGECVTFRRGDGYGIPISQAVSATAAMPMLFAPVTIGRHRFVDGTMTKMLHLSLPLEEGATCLLAISPFRPVTDEDGDAWPAPRSIADGGVAHVAKQALRTLLHNRLEAGLAQYSDRPKHVDIMLIEPGPRDDNALWWNVRKARTRALLREKGYLRGREEVRRLQPTFARHGVTLFSLPLAPSMRTGGRVLRSLDRLEASLEGRGPRPGSRHRGPRRRRPRVASLKSP